MASSPRKGKETEKSYRRLPKCIVPIHYDLSIRPDETEPILDGELSVRVQILCDTKDVVLNGLNIEVSKAQFQADEEKVEAKDIFADKESETIQIEFPSVLKPGFGTLHLTFDAQITDNMKGLYRTEIVSCKGGHARYNFITHFEPVNARRCFPCWDEPEFKATFDVTLIVPKDLVAISNMPLKEMLPYEKCDKLSVCKYETTPKMSTYLVAFVIGEFDFVEKTNEDGVVVRVYTPPGKKAQGEFSVEFAAKVLTYYKNYFQVPYPLPKCDLVAIREFPIGAMENWGLVTFRDSRLLVDVQETSAVSKQWICLIVAHELAHKWFGNLVTMKWWTDLWLKEGFANFIEFLCVDHFFPEYDCWTQFSVTTTHPAFETDGLNTSHPIEVPVTNPSEIDEIFDSITYDKGSSINNMLYNFIGDELFRKGMNLYLTKFQFKNAETTDLWEALEEASSKPVGKLMDTFTKQMGFPLVSIVDVQQDQTNNARTFTLKQEKFLASFESKSVPCNLSSYKWVIPLSFCKGSDPNEVSFQTLFDGKESNTCKVTVPNIGPDEWVKINAGIKGYYRVSYQSNMLAQFVPAIEQKTMAPLDRLGLLSDLYATIRAGRNSAPEILNLLKSFKNEDNYSVLTSIRDVVDGFHHLLLRTDIEDKFKAFAITLFKPLKERIGWEKKTEDGHTDDLLRSFLLNRLVCLGDKETVDEAKKLFELHISGEKMLPADLRSAVYRAVLTNANSEAVDLMLTMYREAELSEEKTRILQSVGALTDKALLQQMLDFSISSEVKPNETYSVFFSLSTSKLGQDLSWKFFKQHVKLFQERFPGGMMICNIVKRVTGGFIGEDYAEEVESFFKKHPFRGTERTLQQIVENIRTNTAWLSKDLDNITAFLQD